MIKDSKIRWTTGTWNPIHGCSKVSNGCAHCYAMELSLKRGWTTRDWTVQNEADNVGLKPHKLHEPYSLSSGARVFVNSMSDMFHRAIPDWYKAIVWSVMLDLPQIVFQVLTKRGEALADWDSRFLTAVQSAEFREFARDVKHPKVKAALAKSSTYTTPWADHIWQGVSVEESRTTYRIDQLRACGAKVKFISAEPLLGDLGDISLDGIHWIIVGGESGAHMGKLENSASNPRWMQMQWAVNLKNIAVRDGCAYFFKQDSGFTTEQRPYLIENGKQWQWEQYPHDHAAPIWLDAPKYTDSTVALYLARQAAQLAYKGDLYQLQFAAHWYSVAEQQRVAPPHVTPPTQHRQLSLL